MCVSVFVCVWIRDNLEFLPEVAHVAKGVPPESVLVCHPGNMRRELVDGQAEAIAHDTPVTANCLRHEGVTFALAHHIWMSHIKY